MTDLANKEGILNWMIFQKFLWLEQSETSLIMICKLLKSDNLSLMENYAIRRLQEQFVLNIAAEVMFDEAVKYMESEMEDIDQRERIENPPREVKIWKCNYSVRQ